MIHRSVVVENFIGHKLHRARCGTSDKQSSTSVEAVSLHQKLRNRRLIEEIDALAGKRLVIVACEPYPEASSGV